MKTDYVEIVPTTGRDGCSSHHLFKRSLLLVERSGANFNIIVGLIPTPNTREVQYIPAFGILRFAQPFNDGETVKAWYKL